MEGGERYCDRTWVAAVLRPRRTGSNRWHEQNDAARKRSPAKFQDFLAHEGRSDLSHEELQKLFAHFLEWERRAKN